MKTIKPRSGEIKRFHHSHGARQFNATIDNRTECPKGGLKTRYINMRLFNRQRKKCTLEELKL